MSLTGQILSEADILSCEQNAISKIKNHMIEEFNASLLPPKIAEYAGSSPSEKSNMDKKFWLYVTRSFLRYFERVDNFYNGVFINPKKRRLVYSKDVNNELKSEIRYYTAIDVFKEAFDEICETDLRYSRRQKKCKELFSNLMTEIHAASLPAKNTNQNVLGKIHFDYINEMLDIQDEDVVRLLPFLLTAYIYNFRNNRFIQRKLLKKSEFDSIYDADKTQAPRIRKNLQALSTRFGFMNTNVSYPSANTESSSSNSRPTVFRPYEYPSLKDRPILDLVFIVWCIIFSGSEEYKSDIPPRISKTVDVWLCHKLYAYYTDKAQYTYADNFDKSIAKEPKEKRDELCYLRDASLLQRFVEVYKENQID